MKRLVPIANENVSECEQFANFFDSVELSTPPEAPWAGDEGNCHFFHLEKISKEA